VRVAPNSSRAENDRSHIRWAATSLRMILKGDLVPTPAETFDLARYLRSNCGESLVVEMIDERLAFRTRNAEFSALVFKD